MELRRVQQAGLGAPREIGTDKVGLATPWWGCPWHSQQVACGTHESWDFGVSDGWRARTSPPGVAGEQAR